MDGNRITHAPSRGFGPWKTRWNSIWRRWTPRIVLWTLASLIGLWLGTSARPAAARGHAGQPSVRSQASLADVFRWDILLTGQEPAAKPVRPAAPKPRQFRVPPALLCELQQRPEPVPSVFPKTLSNAHPRFTLTPPGKPNGAWQMKWDARMASLEHTQEGLRVVLATVPGLTPADRKSIQVEVDKACAQVGSLRMQQAMQAPDSPEPPMELPGKWQEPPSAHIMQ
jgi:hypothetical protein